MVKVKKKGISDVLIKKKTKVQKKLNPFEMHINRQKFKVLGRVSKADKGLPGVAKARSIKKRKETLLQEYKLRDKANKFLDKRIGERNTAMTQEDKIMARFAAERAKAHKRKAIYNLADDEVLTHKGRAITEIEQFEDPRSDEEDDDFGNPGGLDASFTEGAHFGGGMFKKTNENRESIIEQLIAESKKRKAERQQLKEKTFQQTEALDSEWKELMPLLSTSANSKPVDEPEPLNKKGSDSYDLFMKQLTFEERGKPSDKLKSEEQVAAEEAKRLAELEEARLKRMRGEDTTPVLISRPHRSADDLDDGFDFGDEKEEFTLMYDKDGNPIGLDKIDNPDAGTDEDEPTTDRNNSNVSGEEEEENEDEDEDDVEEEDAQNDEAGSESEDSECGDEVHDLTDLKLQLPADDSEENSDSESEEPEEPKTVPETKRSSSSPPKLDPASEPTSEARPSKPKKRVSFNTELHQVEFTPDDPITCEPKSVEDIKADLLKKKQLMEEARKELPYTFEAPKLYEDLQLLMDNRTLEQQVVIIERIIKCHHPSLKEENKEKMNTLFALLLQLLNDAEPPDNWNLLDLLAPIFYELTQFDPKNAAHCLVEVIKEKHADYEKRPHKYPLTDTLVFLMLVPLLFPASDKRHPVTTPALVFISQLLAKCIVTTRRAIASGLFLVSLMIEYTSLSKRISPEAVNFINGLICSSVASVDVKLAPPFKREHKFLCLLSPCSMELSEMSMRGSDLAKKSDKIDNSFRVRCTYCALDNLLKLLTLYEGHPSIKLLFGPIGHNLSLFEVENYPEPVRRLKKSILDKLNDINSTSLDYLVVEKRKPKVLRLYEPDIQPVYETKKRKYDSEEKAEHDKLLHKYKKEMKGAIREIRRDRSFLAKVKLKEIASNDAERMAKVKQIYKWGAEQQSELNKMDRLNLKLAKKKK